MSADNEDKMERLWRHADEMFAKVDKMFSNFPWSEPLSNDGFFHRTVSYTNPVMEESEPANDPVEYKVVKVHDLVGGFADRDLETSLNELGADGWELEVWDGSRAIFMRFVEDEDEAEESGPEDV